MFFRRSHRSASQNLTTAACLLAVLLLSSPARAGYYEVNLQSQGGEAVYTPINGSPQTTSLSQPAYSQFGISGSFAYTFTQTYAYQWHQTVPDDDPVDDVFLIDGEGTLDFDATMMAMFQTGSATASISIGTYTAGASATAGPNGQGGINFNEEGIGTHQLDPGFLLTGESGTFDVVYSGSVTTTNQAVVGHWTMANPNTGWKLIKIHTSSYHTNLLSGLSDLDVSGWWSDPPGFPRTLGTTRWR